MSELTYREMQIAEFTAAGDTAKEIGKKLGLEEQTVKNLKVAIYRKLGVKNAPAMVRVLERET